MRKDAATSDSGDIVPVRDYHLHVKMYRYGSKRHARHPDAGSLVLPGAFLRQPRHLQPSQFRTLTSSLRRWHIGNRGYPPVPNAPHLSLHPVPISVTDLHSLFQEPQTLRDL